MDITWHGHSCFTIKGKRATVITDPYANTGFKYDRLKGDMVLVSELQSEKLTEVDGTPVRVDLPGEYEVKGVSIQGIQAWTKPKSEEAEGDFAQKTVIYIFQVDDTKICHLGSIGHTLPDEMIEKIGDVDILLIPVGGKDCLDAKKAHEVIEDIEPRLVIPMNFAVDSEKVAYDGVEPLLKISGVNTEPKESFSLAGRAQLPQDKTDYVVLSPR